MTTHSEAAKCFKKGDVVRIARTCDDFDSGWNNVWTPSMHHMVGTTFVIKHIDDTGVYSAVDGQGFPAHCLEHVGIAKLQVRANTHYITRNGQVAYARACASKAYPFEIVGEGYLVDANGFAITPTAPCGLDLVREATSAERCIAHDLRESEILAATRCTIPETSTTPKENTMSPIIKVTQKTLVNGQDIETMSEETLFATIEQAERDVKRLEAIESKPAALKKRIEAINEGIKALVAAADARFSA